MATFAAVQRAHILAALAEYDERGQENFLGVYSYEATPGYLVLFEGRSYYLTVVLGVAHRYATGRLAPASEIDKDLAVSILRRRGFEVAEPARASRPTRTNSAAPRSTKTRAAAGVRAAGAVKTKPVRSRQAAEVPPRVCLSCFMTIPATGICDSCG